MKMPDLVICNESVKYMPSDSIWDQWFSCPLPNDDEVGGNYGIRVSWARGDALDRSKRNCGGKTLEDHVKSWVRRKLESGVPQSRCSFPFLVGSRKMAASGRKRMFVLRSIYISRRGDRMQYTWLWRSLSWYMCKEKLGVLRSQNVQVPST
ncbi:histone-lysine N-methyltransferase ASHR3-like isoform X1 [Cucurbita pepo subsp. pepo]|uniref:histone-lysine N-methyltransferase ASHR3-like isoform X1 n=1 Tax=Cucurbita pepo subsp. pepo TaxID=3664 RepID=UPI000C9D32F9|nr:histone-lysine N-methyltransferase ASHR3-like isoform X1 [Cucurbita pepo subsp. pepo]